VHAFFYLKKKVISMNWKWIMFWETLNRFQTVAVSTLLLLFIECRNLTRNIVRQDNKVGKELKPRLGLEPEQMSVRSLLFGQ